MVDATTLAPTSRRWRIATGRDHPAPRLDHAARGARFHRLEVTAVVDELPNDDVTALVRLG